MPAKAYDDPLETRIPEPAAAYQLPVALRAAIIDAQRLQAEWVALPPRRQARGRTSIAQRAFNDSLATKRHALRVAIERAHFAVANQAGAAAVAMREHFGELLPDTF